MSDDWCERGQTEKAWCDHCAYSREKEVAAELASLRENYDELQDALRCAVEWMIFREVPADDIGFKQAAETLARYPRRCATKGGGGA